MTIAQTAVTNPLAGDIFFQHQITLSLRSCYNLLYS